MALQVEFLGCGLPLDRAKALAAEGARGLSADPVNGDMLWADLTGHTRRGGGGLRHVVEQLARREHMRNLGPDPLVVALQRLEEERGVLPTEARPLLQSGSAASRTARSAIRRLPARHPASAVRR